MVLVCQKLIQRLSSSKSTWAILHSAETSPYTFNPAISNMDELIKDKTMTKNIVLKDIYDSLLTCRKNLIFQHPNEFLSIPINGEQLITKKFSPINQPWCTNMMIKDVLTHHGDWKEVKDFTNIQKPAFFERAISDHIEEYKYRCGENYIYGMY